MDPNARQTSQAATLESLRQQLLELDNRFAELGGAGLFDVLDRQGVLDERQKLHSGLVERITVEYRFMHPTQGQKWIHHVARVSIRTADGNAVRTFGIVRDIPAQKRA